MVTDRCVFDRSEPREKRMENSWKYGIGFTVNHITAGSQWTPLFMLESNSQSCLQHLHSEQYAATPFYLEKEDRITLHQSWAHHTGFLSGFILGFTLCFKPFLWDGTVLLDTEKASPDFIHCTQTLRLYPSYYIHIFFSSFNNDIHGHVVWKCLLQFDPRLSWYLLVFQTNAGTSISVCVRVSSSILLGWIFNKYALTGR